ncbi:hypothetical protein CHGG_08123 [Chaetomium globosum CBS 148.51]|uniref:Box C/D snoRNA protein 1 n=1 Tax=Chaetomium globosum (strain ATCC 6205 / CBS 148.51 / DSM 1962 / NBRC 6347 / NRRL 1970) TaxID=306901 RepID=Q2GV81_CHAGB|nr:uncharacterized protein CHGG_08123 [Chaetomium globosum CBS 148.51]EAQ86870.1 hypothetical protein CHGG_08123 [Chaetomium globosum CBS 148.51]
MSETVLSTLCSICHTEPPKYKCPRCNARTCSLPCIQKHKARADCDGQRNPRAFMPLNQLKTPAGIDHDFNFLSSIERARERAEKDVVEARQLLSEQELRPQNQDKVFHKVWYGDELRHVPVQTQPYKKPGRPQEAIALIDGFDKHVRRRLRFLGIEAITMPKGMARSRDNKTSWNRRTQSINWRVEWLIYRASDLGFPGHKDHQQPLRILFKALEGTPLHAGLATALDWHRGQLDRQSHGQPDPAETDNESDPDEPSSPPPPKKRKTLHANHKSNKKHPQPQYQSPTQDPSTSTWPAAPHTSQYPFTSAWSQTTTHPHIDRTLEEELLTWDFYLVGAATGSAAAAKDDRPRKTNKTVVPLSAAENLASALAGRTVLEFPTVMAVPRGWGVPQGCVVGLGERRQPRGAGERVEGLERERGVRGGGGGERVAGGNNTNNNSKKRAFEGGYKAREWGQRGGVRGGFGRGGKRARHDTRGPPQAVVEQPGEEAEEGEVNSDGGEVIATIEAPFGVGSRVDIDWGASSVTVGREADYGSVPYGREVAPSSVTVGRDEEDGEIQEVPGERRLQGGLVDYGSTDESD